MYIAVKSFFRNSTVNNFCFKCPIYYARSDTKIKYNNKQTVLIVLHLLFSKNSKSTRGLSRFVDDVYFKLVRDSWAYTTVVNEKNSFHPNVCVCTQYKDNNYRWGEVLCGCRATRADLLTVSRAACGGGSDR